MAKKDNVSSGAKKNSSGPESKVGKIAEAIATCGYGKVHYCQFSETKAITRRPEENRCGSESKVGTGKGATN